MRSNLATLNPAASKSLGVLMLRYMVAAVNDTTLTTSEKKNSAIGRTRAIHNGVLPDDTPPKPSSAIRKSGPNGKAAK